ncbi:hypothetical protein IW140_003654 [Coemansia sp. RSA 1813]|nr:Acyl-coenzyme A thioesterase 13 [Coemansia sp. RSA 1646]KAJ1770719.1 hypothetical protein LPJ74_002922 [Coemansia sp. RSA 1843]KAJ2088797.1 hypothetical protein IW138_003971 [Coemansia sp. RSA 986]KAJ2213733.1 hypothetical protein EV179_003633 [Coemansia sp. RSA 487]KAJ2568665.1 hypothetical protein IW140_003654 [Coemansia sp. RSA 1813]
MEWMHNNVYGSSEDVKLINIDAAAGTAVLRLRVASHHVTEGRTLDEGLVATVADNWTSYVLVAQAAVARPTISPFSVSTSLSVRTLQRVSPGATIDIECSVPCANPIKPFVTAVFRDANFPDIVYSVATHTKEYKSFASANL